MSEIHDAIQQICDEKNIPIDSVLATIEAALAAAYRKDFGQKNQNVQMIFDLDTGSMEAFDVKTVVEDMDLEELENARAEIEAKREAGEEIDEAGYKHFNPKTEIMLTEAKELDKKAKLGDELRIKLDIPDEFGRMAAQTAKQVIIQRLREAEREVIFNEFKNRENEIISGTIQRREGRLVLVDLGQTMAILPPEEQVPGERYNSGQRFKFLLLQVQIGAKGPELVVSRAHPNLLIELFKIEVPEIASGVVEIKTVAREAGSRSKVAVFSHESNIDPVGSCVGQRGTRVQTVIAEIGGEKIDIIEWSENLEKFISSSLSPAKVESLELDEAKKTAKVKVKSDQLSLAIGRAGQNVRLAAKLTNWRIDIEGAEEILQAENVEAPIAEAKTESTEVVAVEAEPAAPANETLVEN